MIVLGEQSQEQVVTGRGIAFKKKVGDNVEEDKVTQIFHLANETSNSNIQEMLKDVSIDIIEIANHIAEYAKEQLTIEINNSVVFALIDHINNALSRQKQNLQVPNIMEWDIKRFYPKEYEIGKKGLEYVNKRLDVTLPPEEASFIALHLANSQLSEHVENMYDLTELMSQITNIVKYYYKSEIDENSVYFDRFRTHLKFFCYRILNHETYESTGDNELYDMVKMKYANEYRCTQRIQEFVNKQYHHEMSKEEQLYLMIHIAKLVQPSK